MKRFYSKFRIALMTLAIGLASVWFFKGTCEGFFDVPVELPEVESENVLVVFQKTKKQMPFSGGGGSGRIGTLSGSPEASILTPNSIEQTAKDRSNR